MVRYRFDHWEIDGEVVAENPYTFTVSQSVVARAVYSEVVTPSHLLSVSSSPLNVPFTIMIGGQLMSDVTPWNSLLDEGIYEVTMPASVSIGADTYDLAHWEDGSTNPVRRINLLADTPILATYQLVPPPGMGTLEVHAFAQGIEVSAQGLIVETSQTFTTPAIIQAAEGPYTIELTYQEITRQYTVQVVQDQTTRVDAELTAPVTPRRAWLPAIPVVVGLGLVLYSGARK